MEKEKEEKEDKLNKVKKKVAAGATAAGLSASVLLGGLFQSPEELMQKNASNTNQPENSHVFVMADPDEEETEEEKESEEDQKEGKGVFARIKKKILDLPAAVRACVGIPLWAVGWLLIHLLSIAWEGVLAPVFGFLLKWVIGGLLLVGVFAAAMKCAFPNLPLKKILRPKNILFLVLGTVVLGVLDRVIPLFWSGYSGFRFVIILGGGLVVLLAVGIPFVIRQTRKEKEEKALPEKKGFNALEIVKRAERESADR